MSALLAVLMCAFVAVGAKNLVLCTMGTKGGPIDCNNVELLSAECIFGSVVTEGFALPSEPIRACVLRVFHSLGTCSSRWSQCLGV